MNDSVSLIHRVKEQVLVLLAARADVEEAMKSSQDRYELGEMLRPILRGLIARQSIRLNRREYFAVEGLIVDELVSSTKRVPLVNGAGNAADEHIGQTVCDFPIVDEMSQFASFPEATQRYICEALAIGLTLRDRLSEAL